MHAFEWSLKDGCRYRPDPTADALPLEPWRELISPLYMHFLIPKTSHT